MNRFSKGSAGAGILIGGFVMWFVTVLLMLGVSNDVAAQRAVAGLVVLVVIGALLSGFGWFKDDS